MKLKKIKSNIIKFLEIRHIIFFICFGAFLSQSINSLCNFEIISSSFSITLMIISFILGWRAYKIKMNKKQ